MKRLLLLSLFLPTAALAAGTEINLVIENHRFTPAEFTIPAGQKVKISLDNRDDTPEEFDSRALNREKVVLGKSKGVVFIGPLTPGRYPFQGEFHADTAQGAVIAK